MNNTSNNSDIMSVDFQTVHNVGAGGVDSRGSMWGYRWNAMPSKYRRSQAIRRANRSMGIRK